MKFWSRYFPIFERPRNTRTYKNVGSTDDRWQGSSSISFKEREWDGLAAITIRVGRQSITFYGNSIRQMQGQLAGIPRRIEQGDFLSSSLSILGGVGLVYNYAHKIAGRGRVFDSMHPSNSWYANTLDAIIHADGLVSAVASSKRPWHLMKFAFAPGFFDSIQRYLVKSQSERTWLASGLAPMLTVVERFAAGLPRGSGSAPAARLAPTGESFRPLLFCQDGPAACSGAPGGRFSGAQSAWQAQGTPLTPVAWLFRRAGAVS